MKKIVAILGSLLVFAGARSQTVPTVKKETLKPVKIDSVAVKDSMQKQLKNNGIRQINPAMKEAVKITNAKIKLKEAKPLKD